MLAQAARSISLGDVQFRLPTFDTLCFSWRQVFYQKALDIANNMDAGSDHVDIALAFE